MKQIAIANTLKPADDVRAFEKIAQSIAKTNKYEINIIGNSGKKESDHPYIHFYPHQIKRRSLLSRFIVREKVFFRLLRMRPEILIITTHELINTAFLLKLLTGCKVVYDVQEDYKKNLIHLSRSPFRILAGHFVRTKELFSKSFISQFWLAEKCYQNEIPFPQSRTVVLENKARHESIKPAKDQGFQVLFSGTISCYSQVFLAIEVYRQLAGKLPESRLLIIGQCHHQQLSKSLEEVAEKDSNIQLIISQEAISHTEIIAQIFSSDLGIVSYQENEVNKNKIPTKLYEYSRYSLPYLIQEGTSWAAKSQEYGGAIPINFSAPDLSFILNQLENPAKLFPDEYPESEKWEWQEELIFSSLKKLDNNS